METLLNLIKKYSTESKDEEDDIFNSEEYLSVRKSKHGLIVNSENNLTEANNFIKERLKSIIAFCKESEQKTTCTIHYDQRVGTVLKNETGKFLLRLPEQEQLEKLREKTIKSSKEKRLKKD